MRQQLGLRILVVLGLTLGLAGGASAAQFETWLQFLGPGSFASGGVPVIWTHNSTPYWVGPYTVQTASGPTYDPNGTPFDATCISFTGDVPWVGPPTAPPGFQYYGAWEATVLNDVDILGQGWSREQLWEANWLDSWFRKTTPNPSLNAAPWADIHQAIWDVLNTTGPLVVSANSGAWKMNAAAAYGLRDSAEVDDDLANIQLIMPKNQTLQPFLVGVTPKEKSDTPEPASWALLMMGSGFAFLKRRRRA